jgi:hypothetical protein
VSFSNRTACAPFALARLFDEPYERVCRRLELAGGDNGWATFWSHRVAQLRVHGAWQIERTKAAA